MGIELSIINEILNEQLGNAVDKRKFSKRKSIDTLILIETIANNVYKKSIDVGLEGEDVDSMQTLGRKAKSFRDILPFMD